MVLNCPRESVKTLALHSLLSTKKTGLRMRGLPEASSITQPLIQPTCGSMDNIPKLKELRHPCTVARGVQDIQLKELSVSASLTASSKPITFCGEKIVCFLGYMS